LLIEAATGAGSPRRTCREAWLTLAGAPMTPSAARSPFHRPGPAGRGIRGRCVRKAAGQADVRRRFENWWACVDLPGPRAMRRILNSPRAISVVVGH
jgi:hypothetical protein